MPEAGTEPSAETFPGEKPSPASPKAPAPGEAPALPGLLHSVRKVIPLLAVQAVMVILEAGADDFGEPLLAMAYAFAILDLIILHKKERFLGSADFRRGCVIVSIAVSVIATILAPYIPWGCLRR